MEKNQNPKTSSYTATSGRILHPGRLLLPPIPESSLPRSSCTKQTTQGHESLILLLIENFGSVDKITEAAAYWKRAEFSLVCSNRMTEGGFGLRLAGNQLPEDSWWSWFDLVLVTVKVLAGAIL